MRSAWCYRLGMENVEPRMNANERRCSGALAVTVPQGRQTRRFISSRGRPKFSSGHKCKPVALRSFMHCVRQRVFVDLLRKPYPSVLATVMAQPMVRWEIRFNTGASA
jgi:hypothetical protein